MLLGFCVLFLVVLYLQYCIIEDSPTKCEIHDIYIYIYIYVRGVPMVKILLGGIISGLSYQCQHHDQ